MWENIVYSLFRQEIPEKKHFEEKNSVGLTDRTPEGQTRRLTNQSYT